MITQSQLRKAHEAAKMIELDGAEAFHTCCQRFGHDVGAALVVAHIRHRLNPEGKWPDEDLESRANEVLIEAGLIRE